MKVVKASQTLKWLVSSAMSEIFKSQWISLVNHLKKTNLPPFLGYELMKIQVIFRYRGTLFLSKGKEHLVVIKKWYLHGVLGIYHPILSPQCCVVRIRSGQENLGHRAWVGLACTCQTRHTSEKLWRCKVTYEAPWKRDHKWCSVSATACPVLCEVFLRFLIVVE